MQRKPHPIEDQVHQITKEKEPIKLANDLFLLLSETFDSAILLSTDNDKRKEIIDTVTSYTVALQNRIEKNILIHPESSTLSRWINVADELLKKGDYQTASIIQDRLEALKIKGKKNEALANAFESLDDASAAKLKNLNQNAMPLRLTKLNQYANKNVSIPFIQMLTGFKENIKGLKDVADENKSPNANSTTETNIQNQKKAMLDFATQVQTELAKQREVSLLLRTENLFEQLQRYAKNYETSQQGVDLLKRDTASRIERIVKSAIKYSAKEQALDNLIVEQEDKIQHRFFQGLRKNSDTTVIAFAKEFARTYASMPSEQAEVRQERKKSASLFSQPPQPDETSKLTEAWKKISKKINVLLKQNTNAELHELLIAIKKPGETIASPKDYDSLTRAISHLSSIANQIDYNPAYQLLRDKIGNDLKEFALSGSRHALEMYAREASHPSLK